jgi:hypothetical protein
VAWVKPNSATFCKSGAAKPNDANALALDVTTDTVTFSPAGTSVCESVDSVWFSFKKVMQITSPTGMSPVVRLSVLKGAMV